MDKIHAGRTRTSEGDLMVGCEAGSRVGWSTTTGGMRVVPGASDGSWIPAPSIEDNTNNWYGGPRVRGEGPRAGVLLLQSQGQRSRREAIDLLDIAPDRPRAARGSGVPADYDRPALAFEN
jgi:hypothetical protein